MYTNKIEDRTTPPPLHFSHYKYNVHNMFKIKTFI